MPSAKHCQTFPLRIPVSTRAQASEVAKRLGVSLNYFILVAVAERIARLEKVRPIVTTEHAATTEEVAQVVAIDERL